MRDLVLMTLTLGAAVRVAAEAPAQEARAALAEGVRAFEAGRLDEARAALERAER